MAQMSHIVGIRPIVYLPNDLAEEKYNLLELLGADIIKVPPALIVDPKHFYNLAQTRSSTDSKSFNIFRHLLF
jgi:cysteine synthase A